MFVCFLQITSISQPELNKPKLYQWLIEFFSCIFYCNRFIIVSYVVEFESLFTIMFKLFIWKNTKHVSNIGSPGEGNVLVVMESTLKGIRLLYKRIE